MNLTLIDLYLEYLKRNDNDISQYLKKNHSKYKTILEEFDELEETVYMSLDKEKKRIYDEIIYRRVDLEDIKISYSFVEGFMLAMQIAHKITNTNKI